MAAENDEHTTLSGALLGDCKVATAHLYRHSYNCDYDVLWTRPNIGDCKSNIKQNKSNVGFYWGAKTIAPLEKAHHVENSTNLPSPQSTQLSRIGRAVIKLTNSWICFTLQRKEMDTSRKKFFL